MSKAKKETIPMSMLIRYRRIFTIVCLVFLWPVLGICQTLDYGPYSGFGLGKGILGIDYAHPLAACVHGTQSPLPASQASVFVSIVYNNDEYSRAFHIDQSAKASFLGIGSGGDELHFGQEDNRSNRAFDIIVEAYGEHDSQTLDHIDWDTRYAQLMTSPSPATLAVVRAECGDRYIQTVFNQSRLFAVLHVSSQQSSSLTQFSGKANGSVDLDVFSASASLGGDLNIKSAHQSGAITVDIYSEGLGGIIPTAAAVGIANADGLQDIANRLSAYLTSLHDTGQPVKYHLAALPGMNAGNLTDQEIVDDLTDVKTKYGDSYKRLQNVKTLLGPDQRRFVLIQPQADSDLRQQRALLNAYVAKAAKAHDDCAKAATSDVCDGLVSALGDPPPTTDVELWPVLAPTIGPFEIAINGKFISPGDAGIVMAKSGITLLDAAKSIQNDATDVDILAVLLTPYLSHLDIPIFSPNSSPMIPPVRVGTLLFRGQDLKFPAYWKGPTSNAVAIQVFHADSNSPCPISVTAGSNTIDQSCLTTVGKLLRDAALSEVANFNHPSITGFLLEFGGTTTDCFGTSTTVIYPPSPLFPISFPVMMGNLSGQTAFSPTNITTTARLFLFGYPGPPIKLFEVSETHDLATWTQLSASRLTALPTAGIGVVGIDPCSPRVK